MVKKKVVKKIVPKKSRVNPPIPNTNEYVDYSDLNNGNCFLYKGSLWMKFDLDEQEAINLDTGEQDSYLCEKMVLPVDITINWKRRT